MNKLRAIVTFEVAGKPKEHVETSLDKYLKNIEKDDRITIEHQDREEAIEHDDGMWSVFSECELVVKDLETITWLCINFSPASVEILDPDELTMEARDVTNWFNDLLSKLHEVSANYRNQQGANEHLVLAMNQLIQNAILLALKRGKKTEKELEKDTGISGVQMEPFLAHLVKLKKVRKDGETYTVA